MYEGVRTWNDGNERAAYTHIGYCAGTTDSECLTHFVLLNFSQQVSFVQCGPERLQSERARSLEHPRQLAALLQGGEALADVVARVQAAR